ncbi:glycosyltransferase [Aurantiacibacter gilvus]|uniref:Glycosyltransferase n=1 Tax=Aurantiacibacter gilvus TaxID=3139141 RepID=A0ABU9ID65_9SPHN
MHVVLLGTYDLGKPRTRLLRQSLQAIDPGLQELHVDVWRGVEDKSVMHGMAARLSIGLKMLFGYPWLALRYLFCGRHDVVVIGYMGLFDMLLLAPLAKMRGKPVVWDVFLSVYDTWVRDRGMGREGSLSARLLRRMERRACRTADRLVMDTRAHAALLQQLHDVPESKLDAVLVGAEEGAFTPSGNQPAASTDTGVSILFYGQFIPLHGIDTIIDAALDPRGRPHSWTIVGSGQEAARIDDRLQDADTAHVQRHDWVDYAKLAGLMSGAHVCLGIFGTSQKAASVIPNKVYQTLLCGKPLITSDSPAMRELARQEQAGLYLVPAGDPQALLDAIDRFAQERAELPAVLHRHLCEDFSLTALTRQWRGVLEKAVAQ